HVMTQFQHPDRDSEFSLLDVVPFDAAFGASVHIDDVRTLNDEQTAELRRVWLKYSVLRIRGQKLDDAALVEFGRRFGDLKITEPLSNPLARADLLGSPAQISQAPRDQRYPEVTIVSNVVENGHALGGL